LVSAPKRRREKEGDVNRQVLSSVDTKLVSSASVRQAELSPVPTALVRGSSHSIVYANPAFMRFLGGPDHQLESVTLEALTSEPERLEALLERAWHNGCAELAPDLGYLGRDGETRFGSTLVQPLPAAEPVAMVQVVDTTGLAKSRGELVDLARELREANERLVLSSLREQESAERALVATQEVERLLQRKSVLAGVNAILSSSLELEETLHRVAALALPDLADCSLVQLVTDGAPGKLAVAHVDGRSAEQLQALEQQLAGEPGLAALVRGVLRTGQPLTFSLTDLSSSLSRQLPPVEERQQRESSAERLTGVLRELGLSAGLVVPLSARGQIIGVLALFSAPPRSTFQPLEMEFALELARRSSVAVDNAQLYAEAQRAVRLRDDLLAIVSHDLRNPLGAITMAVQHLRNEGDQLSPPDSTRALELVERSSKHMKRLVEELLEVANIQTDQLVLRKTQAPWAGLVDDAIEMFESAARRKGVQLERHASVSDLSVVCDPERLVRVLANLVGNAVKFTPAGGTVTVTAERSGDDLVVRVRDTGPGVAESERLKLFEQYWKGKQTGRTGMGLGLFIARNIVEAHGGRIWVESQPQQGSTFVFTLPQDAC
jgi:signal transduction histidine kinase